MSPAVQEPGTRLTIRRPEKIHPRVTRRRPRTRREVEVHPLLRRLDTGTLIRTAADTFARGVLVLVIGYALLHAYLYFTSSGHFTVSKVTITGLKHLQREALLQGIPPVRGQNLLLLDIERLAEALTRHPWVYIAAVQRKWPNAVSIQITERKPYARVQLDRVYVMDNFGVLVAPDRPAFRNLPLITGIPERNARLGERLASETILQGLRAMHYLNRLPFFRKDPVFAARVQGPRRLIFATRDRGLQIRMATDRIQEGFRNFKIILDALRPTGEGVGAIDLSFHNKVVIQPRSGNSGNHRSKFS